MSSSPVAAGPSADVQAQPLWREELVLAAFRRAATRAPGYRVLLEETGVDPAEVVDIASFAEHAPLLTKANTFERFSIDELSVDGALPPLADVLTSSGHGGRFSFGVTSRRDATRAAELVDAALDAAFAVRSRPTLTINCLPMGVVLSSNCMTIATTSVREDMALALVSTFGHRFDQLVLVCDPLFMKRLLDSARHTGVDWRRYRVNVIIGEETFGECFRSYVARQLVIHDAANEGRIISSFGVGELGLHLCFETAETVALRRALAASPAFACDLLGDTSALPMIFSYLPERTLMEVPNARLDGFGRMTISMLDASLPIPLLRYQTGDVARLLDRRVVLRCANSHNVGLPSGLPEALIAVRGREREALPRGGHVAIYKDALYADAAVADRLSGAVRLVADAAGCTMHVQLASGVSDGAGLPERLLEVIPEASRPAHVVVWQHDRFPFGMQLDYERKFTHFIPDAPNPPLDVSCETY